MDAFQYFIAGWGAGIFGIAVGFPLDTIKTYQQISTKQKSASPMDVVKLIINEQGIKGLYKGMSFPLISSGFLNSVYFGVYRTSMQLLQTSHGNAKISPLNAYWMQDQFFAGFIGGTAQGIITCPTELIKIRMQMGKGVARYNVYDENYKRNLSSTRIVIDIYKNYGIRGFCHGMIPTIWRDSFGGGIYISTYNCTRYYMYGELNLTPGLFETLVAGGLAGVLSWIPGIPFDTIKTILQGDNLSRPKFKGTTDCISYLYKSGRFPAFFRGFTMITARSVPVNIAAFCGFELILWLCKKLS